MKKIIDPMGWDGRVSVTEVNIYGNFNTVSISPESSKDKIGLGKLDGERCVTDKCLSLIAILGILLPLILLLEMSPLPGLPTVAGLALGISAAWIVCCCAMRGDPRR